MNGEPGWAHLIDTFSPETLECMHRASLSVAERRALELHEAGLGYGRIGRELGITKASAQGAVRRAKRHLGQGK